MSLLPHIVARYRCPATFPAKIPEFLSQRGLSVSTGKWMTKAPSDTKEFGFTITDHVSTANVSGGVLEDGQSAFLLAGEPTLKLWGYGKRNAFYQRVHEALLKSGAEIWHDCQKTAF